MNVWSNHHFVRMCHLSVFVSLCFSDWLSDCLPCLSPCLFPVLRWRHRFCPHCSAQCSSICLLSSDQSLIKMKAHNDRLVSEAGSRLNWAKGPSRVPRNEAAVVCLVGSGSAPDWCTALMEWVPGGMKPVGTPSSCLFSCNGIDISPGGQTNVLSVSQRAAYQATQAPAPVPHRVLLVAEPTCRRLPMPVCDPVVHCLGQALVLALRYLPVPGPAAQPFPVPHR